MKSGPTRKPTKLKILEGNPGKRPLPTNELDPEPFLAPCPTFIKGAGRKEWKRLAPELYNLGLLTKIDQAALAAYCSSFGLWLKVERELVRIQQSYSAVLKLRKKDPNLKLPSNGMVSQTSKGNWIMEPLLSVRKQALEQVHKFLIEFGMTPASRSRITVGKPESEDPLDQLLSTRREN